MRRVLLAVMLVGLWAAPAHGATKTYSSGDLHAAIPDGGALEQAIVVPDSGPVSHVEVSVRIQHPRDSDLTISLVSPTGTEVVLSRHRGGDGANYGAGPQSCRGELAPFDDAFGEPLEGAQAPFLDSHVPEQPLRTFKREDARGLWTLRVADDAPGKAGTLLCWQLTVGRDVTEYTRAHLGPVAAVLSYRGDAYAYRETRLEIVRHGKVRLDAPVRRLARAQLVRLFLRDLDADREPEVIVDLWTGGAHCCTQTLFYRYDRARRRYRPTFHDWGNAFPAYAIVDPNHDGHPELRSHDDRFAYAFTSFAGSVFPPRIWQFDHGRLYDVTRRFPAIVAADARSAWRLYLSYRRQHGEVRGALAAWLADEYLLGREDEGWRRVEDLRRTGELGPRAGVYVNALRAFLRRLGYARK